jgi:hypothetical protein
METVETDSVNDFGHLNASYPNAWQSLQTAFEELDSDRLRKTKPRRTRNEVQQQNNEAIGGQSRRME